MRRRRTCLGQPPPRPSPSTVSTSKRPRRNDRRDPRNPRARPGRHSHSDPNGSTSCRRRFLTTGELHQNSELGEQPGGVVRPRVRRARGPAGHGQGGQPRRVRAPGTRPMLHGRLCHERSGTRASNCPRCDWRCRPISISRASSTSTTAGPDQRPGDPDQCARRVPERLGPTWLPELTDAVQKRSPIRDTLANPVQVVATLVKK